MHPARFDVLVRALIRPTARRTAIGWLAAVALAGLPAAGREAAQARRKKKCKHGFKRCGKTCVDQARDPNNCGGCGNVCDPDQCQVCQGGACVPAADAASCGVCGACQQGRCHGTCAATEQCSDDRCVAACDPPCDAGHACVGQTCVDASAGCAPASDWCGGTPVDCPEAPAGTSCVVTANQQPFCAQRLLCNADRSDVCQTDDDCRTVDDFGPNARCVADCGLCGGGNGCVQFYRDAQAAGTTSTVARRSRVVISPT